MPVPAPGFDRMVIDGSNFLGRATGYDLGDADSKEQFITRLQDYAHNQPAVKLTVFFDGKKAQRKLVGGVEERVTSGNRPADDVLLDFLSQLTAQDRPRCTVVTDDDELAAHARRRGAKVQSVRWLNSRLAPKPPVAATPQPDGSLRREQVSDWEQFFLDPPKRPGKK